MRRIAERAVSLRRVGFDGIHFIDAMTNDYSDQVLAEKIAALQPGVVGVTAITPSIYKAEQVQRIAQEHAPGALHVLGGVHATFMYKQVLSEAPWVDVIVRGEVSETPLCHWHAAVFETLFRRLVDPRLRCVEESCCAVGAPACRFVLNRG
ncbi:hypothetical protein AL073_13950 [Loktanella sp. 1ANDIMAR09]|nr:hypothetical protein AL073_13950 [Loktanella sp. 1ANDIMAR09]